MNIHEKINYKSYLETDKTRIKSYYPVNIYLPTGYPMFTADWVQFYSKKAKFECKF